MKQNSFIIFTYLYLFLQDNLSQRIFFSPLTFSRTENQSSWNLEEALVFTNNNYFWTQAVKTVFHFFLK